MAVVPLHTVERDQSKPGLQGASGHEGATPRSRAQAVASECLDDALGVHRMSSEQFGWLTCLSRQYVDKCRNPSDESVVNMRHLLEASEHPRGRAVVLSYLAAVRGHLSEGDEAAFPMPAGRDLVGMLLDLSADAGQTVATGRAALSDGRIDDRERLEMLRAVERTIATLLGLAKELRR
jgi:hypothetical protein